MMKKPKVYIAGPYSKGDTITNIAEAIKYGDSLIKLGAIPYIPHLTGFWHLICPHSINTWYDYDNEWLLVCDAVWRLEGESTGADNEVELAEKNNKPVFYKIWDLKKWIDYQTNMREIIAKDPKADKQD
jgi:hypothetical protein